MLARRMSLSVLGAVLWATIVFMAKAYAAGFYRDPCEAESKIAEASSQKLSACVRKSIQKTQGGEGELFCLRENSDNLKALSDFEKCRHQNQFFNQD